MLKCADATRRLIKRLQSLKFDNDDGPRDCGVLVESPRNERKAMQGVDS